jgi:hypothetical protein
MKRLMLTVLAALHTGCVAFTTTSTNRQITEVVAIVRSYGEVIPLGTKQPEPNFFSIELEIVSPGELRGAMIDAKSEMPVREDSPLRKVESTLSLVIRHLEQNRGSSSLGDGSAAHVVYSIKVSDIRKVTAKEEPNQPPQRNAGSRPPSDDSPASETPSSLGPRG